MIIIAWAIVGLIVAAGVALAFTGASKMPETPPSDFEVPSTEIGTPIGVVWGKRRQKKPIVVWYGDVKIVKVKVDTGGKK